MSAPTDTFLQSILQSFPEGAVPWVIAAFLFGIGAAAVLIGIAESHFEHKRRRLNNDTLRREHRPSGLENYR